MSRASLVTLPLALARLHYALEPGDRVGLRLPVERIGTVEEAEALLRSGGFLPQDMRRRGRLWLHVQVCRVRSLPDLIRPRLRLLVCGLNPSLYAADCGVPFGRPGNRFWPAARRAGLVEREGDVWAALARGIGFTDLVKRATAAADQLRVREYSQGVSRLDGLVRAHRPGVVCFVGLDGWRRAVDRRARPGWVANGFAGRPAYLMPSTSGRNAASGLPELARHLRRAATGRGG